MIYTKLNDQGVKVWFVMRVFSTTEYYNTIIIVGSTMTNRSETVNYNNHSNNHSMSARMATSDAKEIDFS